MATFAEIKRQIQVLTKNISDATGVDQKIVANVIQYAKHLTPQGRPDVIDELVFIAQMGLRFGITSRFHVQLMFEGLRLKNTNYVSLEDYVRTICIFYSPILDVQIDYVFNCYDFRQDGVLEMSEISALLKTSIISTSDNDDPTETLADLISLVFSITDANHDGYISIEEFRAFVKHDILCIQLFGTVLPSQQIIERFMNEMRTRTPHYINEFFSNERSLCLNEPIIKKKINAEFPGVSLDLS